MRALLLAAAALSLACIGPYPNLAEKVDKNPVIGTDSTTWILAEEERTQLLVLARPDAAGGAFSLATVTRRGDASVQTGSYTFDAGSGRIELLALLLQERLNEAGTPVTSQHGSTSKNLHVSFTSDALATGDRLVLSGDARLAGSWLRLEAALLALAPGGEPEAECALRLVNLDVLITLARVPAFGGAGSIEYAFHPATFQGTLQGSFFVQVDSLLSPHTTVTYTSLVDFGGLRLDGDYHTQTNTSGDGYMFGSLGVTLIGPAGQPVVVGAVRWGQEGGGGDSLQLTSGVTSGGRYHVTIAGRDYPFSYLALREDNVLHGCLPR